jgi:5-methyltetrahydrofolate--homocysteine methyltransferase
MIHTAVKIEPAFRQPVIHVKDASKSVAVVSSLLSKEQRETYTQGIRKDYAELRDKYTGAGKDVHYLSLDEARRNALKLDWAPEHIAKPLKPGTHHLQDFPLAEITEYINWVFFFVTWELRGKFPDILDDPRYGGEARKLYEDAREMLERLVEEKWLTANAVFGCYPAQSEGDDILVYEDESGSKVRTRFTNLRNQTRKEKGQPNLCLSDFLAPADSGVMDYLGAFAVTAGIGIEEKIREFEADHDDYSAIMLKALADRLAEAFTEWLHEEVRRHHWGYAPRENLDKQALFLEKYRGIRPAHGYPACPDHSEKQVLFDLLGAPDLGIKLTENYSMHPAASVSGLMFAHPESRYFFVGKVGRDQLRDYARRKGISGKEAERLLASNLNY